MVGDPSSTWREWLKRNRNGRDLICLDPSDADSTPGRLTLVRDDKTIAWRFYGSLAPLRSPHVLLSGLAGLLGRAREDALVRLPDYRPGPLTRQLAMLAAELVQPETILVSEGVSDFPLEAVVVALEPAFPESVGAARRKAQWLKLIESCEKHEVDLANVVVEGARLGSGRPVLEKPPGVLHMEACGATLLVVAESPPDDGDLGRALDHSSCGAARVVHPDSYRGLLCSFARPSGEDFGMGLIQEIDFASGVVHALCSAVAPAPVRILRLGGLRVGEAGDELGEIRPWQV